MTDQTKTIAKLTDTLINVKVVDPYLEAAVRSLLRGARDLLKFDMEVSDEDCLPAQAINRLASATNHVHKHHCFIVKHVDGYEGGVQRREMHAVLEAYYKLRYGHDETGPGCADDPMTQAHYNKKETK